jgi:hypothetical protein
MEKNIYDLIISELIIAGNTTSGSSGGNSGVPKVTLSNDSNTIDVNVPATPVVVYRSEISNIPSGYTVFSHTITYPGGVTGASTSSLVVTGNITLSIPSLGNTATATSNVTLKKAGEVDIILTSSNTITGVAPLYFGVKTNGDLTITSLTAQPSTKLDFSLTTTSIGRLYIVLPTALAANFKSITDPNGLIIPAASFTANLVGNFTYYILNWNTQFTGANQKKFIINLN